MDTPNSTQELVIKNGKGSGKAKLRVFWKLFFQNFSRNNWTSKIHRWWTGRMLREEKSEEFAESNSTGKGGQLINNPCSHAFSNASDISRSLFSPHLQAMCLFLQMTVLQKAQTWQASFVLPKWKPRWGHCCNTVVYIAHFTASPSKTQGSA